MSGLELAFHALAGLEMIWGVNGRISDSLFLGTESGRLREHEQRSSRNAVDEDAVKILEMKRNVWLSRADACALLQVKGLLEVLKQRAPEGEARASAARILTLQQFREHVRAACFNFENETDHVLLEISEDMYAVLRALGLCGTRDSRGRRICVPEVFKSAYRGLKRINYWATDDAKTALSIYKVLLEQTGILFGLSLKSATGWTRDYVIAFAGDLFGQWQEAVQKAIFQVAYVIDHVVDAQSASAHASEFVTASCELESALSWAVEWRLLKQNKPAALIGFRKTAGCPTAEEASTKPNTYCQRVAGQHARLFAARLAESAVMEALSQLKRDASISFANALCIATVTTPTCDLRRMRLLWEDNQGRWKYYGDLNKYYSAKPVTPAAGILLRVGLSGSTTWGGGDNTGIQKSLTLKTLELSRLSRAHAFETNVWSKEVLNINESESNPVFDRVYANSLKPKAVAPTQNVCDVKPHQSMIRALLSYWSRRADHKYPPWMKSCLTTALTESSLADKLNTCTKEVDLKTKLVRLVQKLNAFADAYENDSSHFHRHIYMVLSDGTAPTVEWTLPLTVDKARYPGLYDFVVWMLCQKRVLKADRVTLKGWYSLNASGQPPVSGSTSTEAL